MEKSHYQSRFLLYAVAALVLMSLSASCSGGSGSETDEYYDDMDSVFVEEGEQIYYDPYGSYEEETTQYQTVPEEPQWFTSYECVFFLTNFEKAYSYGECYPKQFALINNNTRLILLDDTGRENDYDLTESGYEGTDWIFRKISGTNNINVVRWWANGLGYSTFTTEPNEKSIKNIVNYHYFDLNKAQEFQSHFPLWTGAGDPMREMIPSGAMMSNNTFNSSSAPSSSSYSSSSYSSGSYSSGSSSSSSSYSSSSYSSSSYSSSRSSSSGICPDCGGKGYRRQAYEYSAASNSYHNSLGSSCSICGGVSDHYHYRCTTCKRF